ncbi:MAG TPA: hypothetical protein VH268_12355 [Solirubrobacterales bacterium]|nr:hypothetical protein [Solirubrobacterales bacterium]
MRRGRGRHLFAAWLARWGFAAMVGAAVAIGIAAGATIAAPADIPDVALKAVVIYRLEVGGAVFIGVYIAAMAFALALQNRAFTEIGSSGVRAQDMSSISQAMVMQEVSMEFLWEMVHEMKGRRTEREENLNEP